MIHNQGQIFPIATKSGNTALMFDQDTLKINYLTEYLIFTNQIRQMTRSEE